MLSTALLKLLRYSLYLAAIGLAAVELIVVSVALAGLNSMVMDGYYYSLSPWRGGAGWTLFVTLSTLVVIPIIAFGNILASRGITVFARCNMILYETANAVLYTVLWFVAGVVMAHYADDCPDVFNVCRRYKAATAFAWFPFFVFACISAVLIMLLLRVRKSGAPLTTVTYEIDYEAGNAGPPAAPQHIEGQYTQNTKSDGGYYASSPQVAMPAPTN